MSSKNPNSDDGEKVVVRQSDSYGSRHSRLPGVDDAAVSVETPNFSGDEQIGVSAFAFDDEPGQVQVAFGTEVRVGVTLSPADARALAEQLEVAAAEAAADVPVDE